MACINQRQSLNRDFLRYGKSKPINLPGHHLVWNSLGTNQALGLTISNELE